MPSLFYLCLLLSLVSFSAAVTDGTLITPTRRCFDNQPRKLGKKVIMSRFDWVSARMSATVLRILLEEQLGLDVEMWEQNPDALFPDLENNKTNVITEVWYDTRKQYLDRASIIDAGDMGVVGEEGWFIPSYLLKTCQQCDHWGSYQNESVGRLFLPLDKDGKGQFLAGTSTWASKNQELITQLKLHLYLRQSTSDQELMDTINGHYRNNTPVLFYYWSPDYLHAKYNLNKVSFPECKPNSDAPCGYPRQHLKKYVSESLPGISEEAYWLIQEFKITEQELNLALLWNYEQNMTVEDAACRLLKNSTEWKPWVERALSYSTAKYDSEGTPAWQVALIVTSSILTVAIIAGALFKYKQYLESRRLRYAPRRGPLAILFTDIEASTKLWNESEAVMSKALALHNQIIRDNIETYEGYEVKTIGDAFMIAFASPVKAINCALSIQVSLMNAHWAPELLAMEPAAELISLGKTSIRGLRVRMGIDFGEPEIVYQQGGLPIDYIGPCVNLAARAEGAGHGGQLLVTHRMYESIEADLNSLCMAVACTHLGKYSLQGIAKPQDLIQILPATLSNRWFNPLRAKQESETEYKTGVMSKDAVLSVERLRVLFGNQGVDRLLLAEAVETVCKQLNFSPVFFYSAAIEMALQKSVKETAVHRSGASIYSTKSDGDSTVDARDLKKLPWFIFSRVVSALPDNGKASFLSNLVKELNPTHVDQTTVENGGWAPRGRTGGAAVTQ